MDQIRREFEIIVTYYFPRVPENCMCNDDDRYTCRSCCNTYKKTYPVPQIFNLSQINHDGKIYLDNESYEDFFNRLGASSKDVASIHISKKILSIKDQLMMILEENKNVNKKDFIN